MQQKDQVYKQYLDQTTSAILEKLNTSLSGLTNQEVSSRLTKFGTNTLKAHKISWTSTLRSGQTSCSSKWIYIRPS